MADHLDYIRIRGLTSSDAEVFQGIGAASLAASESTGGSTSTGVEWGEIPADAIQMVSDYTTALNEWLAEAIRYDENTGTRALVPELLDNLPVVPIVTTALATATAPVSLPAAATVMLSQVLLNQVGNMVAQYAEAQDPNNPANILRKALLYDDESIIRERLTALITELTNTTTAVTSVTTELTNTTAAVDDLTFVDATVKYADNTSLHVGGKVLAH